MRIAWENAWNWGIAAWLVLSTKEFQTQALTCVGGKGRDALISVRLCALFRLLKPLALIGCISEIYAGRKCWIVRIFISYPHGMRLAACMASWLLPLSSFPVETWLHDRRLGYGKRIKKKGVFI